MLTQLQGARWGFKFVAVAVFFVALVYDHVGFLVRVGVGVVLVVHAAAAVLVVLAVVAVVVVVSAAAADAHDPPFL